VNPRLVELALKKQRLQLKSAILRSAFAEQAMTWAPAFAAADRIREGVAWMRRHPVLPVAMLVALLVARPRALLRGAAGAWVVWRGWQRLRGALAAALTALPGGR
jgi:hypothetical protein